MTETDGAAVPLQEISDAIETRRHVLVCAYLFGSMARGDAGPLSDVDIALLFDRAIDPDRRFEVAASLISDLQRIDAPRVDVAILNDAPPALAHRVVSTGRPLFVRDEGERVAFETRAIQEYLDFQPVLARYDRELLARARRRA